MPTNYCRSTHSIALIEVQTILRCEFYLVYDVKNIALPKNGMSGVDKIELITAWRNNIAECGTLNGWAKAWNAEPHVICQGAMYVTMKWSCESIDKVKKCLGNVWRQNTSIDFMSSTIKKVPSTGTRTFSWTISIRQNNWWEMFRWPNCSLFQRIAL